MQPHKSKNLRGSLTPGEKHVMTAKHAEQSQTNIAAAKHAKNMGIRTLKMLQDPRAHSMANMLTSLMAGRPATLALGNQELRLR